MILKATRGIRRIDETNRNRHTRIRMYAWWCFGWNMPKRCLTGTSSERRLKDTVKVGIGLIAMMTALVLRADNSLSSR